MGCWVDGPPCHSRIWESLFGVLGLGGLAKAAASGSVEMTTVLLKWNADINQRNQSGQTPFMVAVGHGDETMAKHLIRMMANPRERDRRGVPPLLIALEERHLSTATWLLDTGLALDDQVCRNSVRSSEKYLYYSALDWVVSERVMPAFRRMCKANPGLNGPMLDHTSSTVQECLGLKLRAGS